MGRKRKSHTSAFKAQVAVAAVKGDKTIAELASLHGVHPTLIHAWKKQLLGGAEGLFDGASTSVNRNDEELQSKLYEEIGRLQAELTWLKKKLARFG